MAFRLKGRMVESGGPEDRLLPWGRVQDMAGISRTTAWRLQRNGTFPTPVPVSPGRVAWWESELSAWKQARGDARPLEPPMRPRLPGMARRAPMPPASAAASNLKLGPQPAPPTPPKPQAKTRKRPRPQDVNQIDFGF